ncbi:MAG: zf-HC2 domain-containing protein [Bacillota bacterium]
MKCHEVTELLWDDLDGVLSAAADEKIRRHLRGCAACREEREKVKQCRLLLSMSVEDEQPPGKWESFYRGLEKRIREDAKYPRFFTRLQAAVKPYALVLWEKPLAVLVPSGICIWLAGVTLVQLMPDLGGTASEMALRIIALLAG